MTPSKKHRVLVVDDDEDFSRILQITLERAGYAVETAANGAEGLRSFQARRPDIALVDVNMPVIDGLEMCRRIRALEDGRRVPLILITVRSHLEIVTEGLRAGATDYILKPFAPDDLLARVSRALDACRKE